MPRIDGDAARAARVAKAQATNDPNVYALGGRDFVLVDEMPLEFPDLLNSGRFRLAAGVLLSDPDDLEPFLAAKPTIDDLAEMARLYGFDGMGESLASPPSSNGTSKRARPTSNGSTRSTSAKPVGGRRQ